MIVRFPGNDLKHPVIEGRNGVGPEALNKFYKKFDPIINQAIAEFNEELKTIAKKKLF